MKSNLLKRLLEEYRKTEKKDCDVKKIQFIGQGDLDVYNISCPFVWKGKKYILGRVEARDSELSFVGFFEEIGDEKYQLTEHRIPLLQDPFHTIINEKLYVGGTEIFIDENKQINGWHTSIFDASDFGNITRYFIAPIKMKDVRIVQNGDLHIFSRPQGGKAKLGRIGILKAKNITELNKVYLYDATLFTDQLDNDSWAGTNQVKILKNGWLGVLGHVATMSKGDVRHYYGMTFAVNPKTYETTPVKIICERNDFPKGEAKRSDLIDVVFPGELIRNDNGTASIYVGVSDCEAYRMTMTDPFLEYEQL